MKKLKPVKFNGTVGVIAPAFPAETQKIKKGIRYLKQKGFNVVEGRSLTAQHMYFSGSDELRKEDIEQFFADPTIDMIMAVRGGWGTLRLLDQIDYDVIQKNPKPFVGYSDITTLQLAFFKMADLPTFSGPMVAVEMAAGIDTFTEKHFWGQIFNTESWYVFDFSSEQVQTWVAGTVTGRLLGGCLSMVAHQLGTPFMPDFHGAVLFLEDVGEAPYKIDRYLAQLKQAGIFQQITGLILGQFLDCQEENEDRRFVSVEEVLRDYFANSPFPVIYNFPYGHGMRKFTMPIGVQVELNLEEKKIKMQNPFIKMD